MQPWDDDAAVESIDPLLASPRDHSLPRDFSLDTDLTPYCPHASGTGADLEGRQLLRLQPTRTASRSPRGVIADEVKVNQQQAQEARMALGAVNGLLAKLADDADLHDDLKQPQVQVVSALGVESGLGIDWLITCATVAHHHCRAHVPPQPP